VRGAEGTIKVRHTYSGEKCYARVWVRGGKGRGGVQGKGLKGNRGGGGGWGTRIWKRRWRRKGNRLVEKEGGIRGGGSG